MFLEIPNVSNNRSDKKIGQARFWYKITCLVQNRPYFVRSLIVESGQVVQLKYKTGLTYPYKIFNMRIYNLGMLYVPTIFYNAFILLDVFICMNYE